MLLTLDKVAPMLRCPRTGARLERQARGGVEAWCPAGANASTVDYVVVDGKPVLVDFDRSVLERDTLLRASAQSPIVRSHGALASGVRRMLAGRNRVAAAHCGHMIEELVANADRGAPPTVLVIGGGTLGSGAESLYSDARVGVVAFDIYSSPLVQFVADAHAIPIADGTVDGIWIQAVLEHVLDPVRVASEIRRVIRSGGIVYAETPFMQQVHEGAFDYCRFSALAHRWLFGAFEAIDVGTVAGPGTVLLWAWRYLMAGLLRSRTAGALATLPFFWLRFLDRLVDARHASDGASCVYFYGRRCDRALTVRELVASYPGAQV
jgi:SAM-dependent methyltransferase